MNKPEPIPPYTLVRSARKTLALTMDRAGTLTVRAPLSLSIARIEAFVRDKQRWVEQTRARMQRLPPRPEPLTLRDGFTLPYLGRTLTLRRGGKAVTLDGDVLWVPTATVDVAPVVRWLEAQARRLFADRVQCSAAQLGLHPKALRLSRARGRWGSMSTRGTLSLNRALILCPPEVLQYVVVHELCHMVHPNHSAAFWDQVERCLPGYRAQRDWLKAHAALILFLPA